MKKLCVIILFISMMVFSLAAESHIKFKETTIDFGEVNSGEIVDIKFEFENTGDSILIIKNISTSCGCAAAKLEKKEYQPGEKGALPVKFNSRGYYGRVTKSITMATNDKDNVYSRLKITGKVILKNFAAIGLEPDLLDFEKVNIGKIFLKKMSVMNTGTIDLKIIEVTHSPEIVPEFNEKIIKPGEDTTVKITFKPMQKGRFSTFLKIKTNAHRQRLMIVRINADIIE